VHRLAKWAYNLGKKNAREQLKAELYLFIGQEPHRYNDTEFDMVESEASFKRRIDGWFAAREMLQKFLVDNEHLSETEVCITQDGYYADGIFADTFDLPE